MTIGPSSTLAGGLHNVREGNSLRLLVVTQQPIGVFCQVDGSKAFGMPHDDLCCAEPVPTRSAERRYEARFLPLLEAASVILAHGIRRGRDRRRQPVLYPEDRVIKPALVVARARTVLEWADSVGSADLRVRDLLMSRILRCPRLVNRTAEPHGFANCYTHHSGDLVIEWCCGDTVETLCANLLAHAIADGLPRGNAIELLSPHSAHLGDRTVILNRHGSCLYGNKAWDVVEYIKKGYDS